jgi:hypothetical protein
MIELGGVPAHLGGSIRLAHKPFASIESVVTGEFIPVIFVSQRGTLSYLSGSVRHA